MTATLFVRADGTSCGASMVKRSVDFASEAPRCQRISSITPQISFNQGVIGGFFQGALGQDLFALPLADPGTPPIISKFGRETTADSTGARYDARAPRNDGLGSRRPNHDGWEAVTP
jgi:hypothetical protein